MSLSGIGRSKDRLASARLRRGRQVRGLFGIVFLLVIGVGGAMLSRETSPPPPTLIVGWPKPKVVQTVSDGSTLLARRGSSFEVTLAEVEQWNTHWSDRNAEGPAKKYLWKINDQKSDLTVRAQAVADGWQQLISWTWPNYKLQLNAMAATSLGGFRYRIDPPNGGLWVYPHIYVKSAVTWDERALQMLAEPLLPALQGTLKLAVPASAPPAKSEEPTPSTPDQPMWWIVPSFSENANALPVPGDIATYARLNSKQIADDMMTIARRLAAQRSDVSLKFIVRLDAKPPHGTLRIAFDGKGERKGWIRRPGEPSGPLIWNETSSNLSPSLPRS
jgi:hypothetical protein